MIHVLQKLPDWDFGEIRNTHNFNESLRPHLELFHLFPFPLQNVINVWSLLRIFLVVSDGEALGFGRSRVILRQDLSRQYNINS